MANEHLKTAAANIQRAVSDVQILQQELRAKEENAKRDAAARTRQITEQIAQLQRDRNRHDLNSADKLAVDVQIKNLQLEIDKIRHETDAYVSDLEHQISGLNGQVNEFQNLAAHLQMLA
jgi:FtsZ-binding cell division protein ZapB